MTLAFEACGQKSPTSNSAFTPWHASQLCSHVPWASVTTTGRSRVRSYSPVLTPGGPATLETGHGCFPWISGSWYRMWLGRCIAQSALGSWHIPRAVWVVGALSFVSPSTPASRSSRSITFLLLPPAPPIAPWQGSPGSAASGFCASLLGGAGTGVIMGLATFNHSETAVSPITG